ncbi:LysR family transcriptional regulator [Kribbella pittospori]|uniref:LysR family transcriptional regulator n=1 Tax=Kribbella pittospori TaxID=722689 RepID=A0A4R0JL01_9ACTN|nr:LysR family transcriptional regulator [Kribbella pittospori]TCC46990.1 LysR family transcriptional regulator [Kribbella pittospori]
MLERYELETFLTLAEELHFGRTAERMHVSTARVSQTIKGLERRVGAPLFNRTSRRVELTPIGHRLAEDLQPAQELIAAGFERAVRSARGITGTLRVGFVGAAGGQLLLDAAELLHSREPGCEVLVREVQLDDAVPRLLDGGVEVLLTCFLSEQDDLVTGPALVTEARMLAVPSGHAFADRQSVSVEDLAGVAVLRTPDDLPSSHPPHQTPAEGPAAGSFQEILTLVGAGRGVFLIGAHMRRYYMRPDVAYVPIQDAPPVQWRLMWRTDGATARIHAFATAAHDLVSPDTRLQHHEPETR